jgi:hypothetical protein
LPFTFDVVRDAPDPWQAARELCPGHFRWADGATRPRL